MDSKYRSRLNRTRNSRIGFSLLEVILALALTALVVAAISMAIRLHLIMLTEQQGEIEQTHVARNVLEVISVDIRAAMQYKPFNVDTVDIEQAAEDAGGGAAGGGGETGGGETGGAETGGGETGGGGAAEAVAGMMGEAGGFSDPQEPSASENIQGSVAAMPHPGFYGNNKEIMFNISRLPRMDQYNPYIAAGETGVTIPSDIKTTSFFLDASGQLGGDPLRNQPMGGLYRRQMAHAHASFANNNGYTLSSDATTELLATEVVDISFRYFGNDEWLDAWDSDEEGGFPTAVEITIIVDPRRKEGVEDLPDYTGYDEEFMSIHRKVVHLPVAEMLSEEELQAIEGAQQSVAGAAESAAGGSGR